VAWGGVAHPGGWGGAVKAGVGGGPQRHLMLSADAGVSAPRTKASSTIVRMLPHNTERVLLGKGERRILTGTRPKGPGVAIGTGTARGGRFSVARRCRSAYPPLP